MSDATLRGVLLDVEGTTSAVSYVYDVMFPYAREHAGRYLAEHLAKPDAKAAGEQMARDAGHESLADATEDGPAAWLLAETHRLMDGDVKATGLKQLQGLIWEAGFKSGELKAHVFPDVPPALAAWRTAGVDVRIYSSGSVHAQRLFFAHTQAGDLSPRISGNYDTTTGPKREAESYRRIALDWGLPAGGVLFLSDVIEELEAAATAGMQTALVVRPGNKPVADGHGHRTIGSFAELIG
ncbi:MAG: acireductone synthase [Planctomycetota bacterium]